MARPATGWIRWRRNKKTGVVHWHVQLTLKDGTRSPWVPLDPSIPESDRARAQACATTVSDDARERGFVSDEVKETVAEYAKRWLEAREGRIASVRDNASHLEHHVLPVLGAIDMQAITRKEIERFVAALDAKVRAKDIGTKTAKNVWGTCSKMFDDAAHSKPAEGLRCLEADPTHGVRGPDDDDADRLLQFLYPSELETFLACERVPRTWRRNVAIAIYLCLRVGEQAALKWSSVDLEHRVATIQEKYDRRTDSDKEGTKSGGARIVPIRAELVPLLEMMRKESGGRGYVCELPNLQDLACGLRRWLTKAGLDRAQLHKATTVSRPLRWHDLRATGATWLAVEGKAATEIRDVLGHTQTSMTDRYMRSAAVLRGGHFGNPFPTLPVEGLAFRAGFASEAKLSAYFPRKSCEGRELNPYRSYPAGT